MDSAGVQNLPHRIPAITLYQPWATWIALGLKTIETRRHTRFQCLLGRRIAIHAGKRWDHTAYCEAYHATDKKLPVGEFAAKAAYPRGAVVALATVAEFRLLRGADEPEAMCRSQPYLLWALVLRDVVALQRAREFVGGRGIWYLDARELLFGPPDQT